MAAPRAAIAPRAVRAWRDDPRTASHTADTTAFVQRGSPLRKQHAFLAVSRLKNKNDPQPPPPQETPN